VLLHYELQVERPRQLRLDPGKSSGGADGDAGSSTAPEFEYKKTLVSSEPIVGVLTACRHCSEVSKTTLSRYGTCSQRSTAQACLRQLAPRHPLAPPVPRWTWRSER